MAWIDHFHEELGESYKHSRDAYEATEGGEMLAILSVAAAVRAVAYGVMAMIDIGITELKRR